MVIAIFCHIVVILMDRYLYLAITSTSVQRADKHEIENEVTWGEWLLTMLPFFCKLIMHIALTVFVHILVFFLYPLTGNIKVGGDITCKEPKSK